ncbi:hypothetical protein Tco_1028717 [Tanacetum coccineum]|uniref:Uncharacterized protein n=1 Tax=Tanacetum coccineum TaxID=301880 RepID=A0ABQ5G1P9_9ASTR
MMCSKKEHTNLFKSSTSSTFIDSFMEYELNNMLYNKMQKSGLFLTHDKHLDIYNALIGSIGLDEAIAKGEIDSTKVLKKRRHNDKDEDPSTYSKRISRRERERNLSHLKIKNSSGTIYDDALEADQPVNVREDVVNVPNEKPQDDADPKQDMATWFKQPPDHKLLIQNEVDKTFGYGYLEEMVVRRADQKEYTFKEGDFPRLHLNDIKDMLLLHV